MVRNYERKTPQQKPDAIRRALQAIPAGMSIRAAACDSGPSERSLRRHSGNNPTIVPAHRRMPQANPVQQVAVLAEPEPSNLLPSADPDAPTVSLPSANPMPPLPVPNPMQPLPAPNPMPLPLNVSLRGGKTVCFTNDDIIFNAFWTIAELVFNR